MITRNTLIKLYIEDKLSMTEIAKKLGCSVHKITYWMDIYEIKRRSISEAIYQKNNPNGDPFKIATIKSIKKAKLYGLGIGLYWGEGTKASKNSVRLGNSDPMLLNIFIKFLQECFNVDKKDLRFGLQIFSDIDPTDALKYWSSELDAKLSQFYKVHVTISGSVGTYRHKSKYGVVTIYFNNKKLRDILVGMLPR